MNINVFVHIGPPKTATSAIQNWLQQNREVLIQQGIYYPEHGLDENGVSSGNVLNIFDRNEDKSLLINKSKIEKVLTDCQKNNCKVLLLSSEFFFFQVDELLKVFPDAKLIAYIRFPLEVIESSYNQAVKRHNQTQPLGLPKEPLAYHSVLLEKMLQRFDKSSFIVRFYSQDSFVGGNIVSDLLSVVGVEELSANPPKVNSSYSLEALEFKRWLNCFLPPAHQNRVDRLLQSYNGGTESYSLIKPVDYQRYVEWFCVKLDAFFADFYVEGYQQFVAALKNKPQKTYIKQSMSEQQFAQVTSYILEQDIGLIQILSDEAGKSEIAIEKRPDFYAALKDAVPTTYQFTNKLKTQIREWFLFLPQKFKTHLLRKRLQKTSEQDLKVTDLIRMRTILKIDDEVTDGEMFRELALYCEQNGEFNLAYRLMLQANKLRPNGAVILNKIAEYKSRLNIQEGDS
jgi:hypothetical protein